MGGFHEAAIKKIFAEWSMQFKKEEYEIEEQRNLVLKKKRGIHILIVTKVIKNMKYNEVHRFRWKDWLKA